MLIDCHAHLDDEVFAKDLNDVIQRAKNAGISLIINNGTNPESNRKTLELVREYNIVRPALGIHPTDCIKLSDEAIDSEVEFIKKHKPIAIGEVGLDHYWHKEAKDLKKQMAVFEKMIALAEHMKLPIIVHSRDAYDDAISLLESSRLKKIVLHAFGGSEQQVRRAESSGWFFSIPTNIVHSSQKQMVARVVGVSQILTETDAPYLGPVPKQRNEPAYIVQSIRKIAEIKKMKAEEVEAAIFENARKLFDI